MTADWLVLLAVAAVCAFWILARYQRGATPIEDAAMLLRYAQHLAEGYGLRWNIHDAPVDGATDFLFTVAIGVVARATHLSVVATSQMLILGAHVCSVLLVFIAGRKLLGANRWVCAAMAAYLSAGQAAKLALASFGAPFFAFTLLCCWCAVLLYAARGPSWRRGIAIGVLGLIAGLTRPEGVLITAIFLLGLIVLMGSRPARTAVIATVAVFIVLGGPYFLWHWHYFGYPLPNPFYIKGNGHLYFRSVRQAVVNLAVMLAPVIPLLPLGWLQKKTTRLATALVVVLACFAGMWVLLNDWNNGAMRFQYAIVPVVLLTVPGLLTGLGERQWAAASTRVRRVGVLAAALSLLVSMLYFDREFHYDNPATGMREFALRLEPLASHGDTMVVTEAGTLPLYSRWRAIDALGLNDAYVAHHGGRITDAYLDQVHPDVIMVHVAGEAPNSEFLIEIHGGVPVKGSVWENFEELSSYAVRHGYTLEGAMGAPCNMHFYWVRPGFADKTAFVHALRDYPYYFLDTGDVVPDLRDELPTGGCNKN